MADSKYISIKRIDNFEFDIVINNDNYAFKEFDQIKINGENYYIKSYRVGEVYTKDNGSIDATLITNEYHFKKSEIVNFEINDLPNTIQLLIRLQNKIIELVNFKKEEKHDENITKLSLLIVNGDL